MPRRGTLTRVDDYGGWWAKRDDLANAGDPRTDPAGSKVRQYARMAAAQPGAPMVVGCSADSAMQIYVAAAAATAGCPGIIYTAARATLTAATEYARRRGADVRFVRPGYLSCIRARAREESKRLGSVVRWDVTGAVRDAAVQVANLPRAALRIVVATGSGLTAAGVAAGLGEVGWYCPVTAVAVSPLASVVSMEKAARRVFAGKLPPLTVMRAAGQYGEWVAARLPCGAVLDPYYAAKALAFVRPGDVLWVPGMRPLESIPAACRAALEVIPAGNGGDA